MNDLKNQTVLVTGGAGFIGSHLCERLLSLDAKVVCFDNFFTGKKENILHLMDSSDFELIEGDANSEKDINEKLIGKKIDYIFHYAAVLGVQRVENDPLCVLPDIDGFRVILEFAKKAQVKKVIFSSSSEAYGDSAELPLQEDNSVKHSEHTHLYALVKLMGERIMKIYNERFGVPTVSLRFFNVFGPRQESSAYGFVTGVFIQQVLKDKEPTIYGDGYQTRDFIYIDDNIDLAIKAMFSDKANGHVINVGAGRQTTILDLAEKIIKIGGKDLKPKFIEGRKYEIKYRSPDVTKMHTLLDGRIKNNLDENLKKTFEWYRDNVI